MIGFLYFIFLVVILLWVLSGCGARDDTDPPEGRSGMTLYIDHRTGCHYVGNPMGGITPRVDAKGKHICDPKPEGRR
jgi:hypothetical protein